MPGVAFKTFLNGGSGLTGRKLGEVGAGTFLENGIEMQFDIDPAVRKQFSLRPTQWSGPEAVWKKVGSPLSTPWMLHRSSRGSGSDDPEPENIKDSGSLIAYFDSPGPNMAPHLKERPSRLFVVQNFTGWIVGQPLKGGALQNLCEPAAWFSIVDLVDANVGGAIPSWQRWTQNRSGTGWASTSMPLMF